MANFIRVEVGDCVVRFFGHRTLAIVRAERLTQASGKPHCEFLTEHGWVVRNEETLDLIDNDGPLPDEAAFKLSQKLWTLWVGAGEIIGYAWGRTADEARSAFRSEDPLVYAKVEKRLRIDEEDRPWPKRIADAAFRANRP